MSEILVEPVKTMLKTASDAATSLLQAHGIHKQVEIAEYTFDRQTTVYIKFDGDIMYKKMLEADNDSELLDVKAILYGALLTEVLTTYCLAVERFKEEQQKGNIK